MAPTKTAHKKVLVTGANGYIGNAVARAFSRAGWTTYGLVRKESSLPDLASDEIIPLFGSPSDTSFVSNLQEKGIVFDVIVSTTEQIMNYFPHYNEIVSLLRILAKQSKDKGIRPLVIFTSGCKDYGTSTFLSTSKDKAPHTEESPLNPPTLLMDRANGAITIFEHEDLFDAIVTRPTNVYGLSSSFYGLIFKFAEQAKKKGVWQIDEHPDTILHAMHVDDCGEAYVALAEAERSVVKGQCYNMSASEWETLRDVASAVAKEYGVEDGVRFVEGQEGRLPVEQDWNRMLLGWTQWIGSEKLRKDTGWYDKRQLFSEGIHAYRLAYEVSIQRGGGVLQKIENRKAAMEHN
ncbi:NAD(P)-binding protein [Mollisia scopiformis]|uniref:NAD(P)-binding protein n=1 Tax=Mollisia scopiformis TaxID=149040 RepID=A0A194WVZ3_MOLSC|nr:NAD(P)-binding protein [Mollisia scopiformis]KUJ11844.1 NAD(P)-binding protein [Mollisia scopiformis]